MWGEFSSFAGETKTIMTMKKTMGLAVAGILLASVSAGCSHKGASQAAAVPEAASPVALTGGVAYIPRATVFRMSGPYADHVAVTLGADGNLTYFPAPTDISENSLPVYLGKGWWLNRQGLGPNSVFTSWTMAEYARLSSTPTAAQIKAHIIPDAHVTEFRSTSVLLPDAMQELSTIKAEL